MAARGYPKTAGRSVPVTTQGPASKRQRMSKEDTALRGWEADVAESSHGTGELAVTCSPCRTKKIKCDSKKPVCENCAKNPENCQYPRKMKPGFPRGTVTDVLERLVALEERMRLYETAIATGASQPMLGEQPYDLFGETNPSNSLAMPHIASEGTSQSVNDLESILQPMLHFTPGLTGLGSANSSSMPGPDINTLPSGLANVSSPSGSFFDPSVLPAQDIVMDLIDKYWQHIHPWAPFLAPGPITFSPPWNIVVHAIVVVSLRFSSDPRLQGRKDHYKTVAKQHVVAHAIESTSIQSVQALALLALDLIGGDSGPLSWGILALLTRSAVHLGLVTEDGSTPDFQSMAPSLIKLKLVSPPADWKEEESRRRLFWIIFALDRYACVSTGWDFALPDYGIKRRLPCSDELWGRDGYFVSPLFKSIPHLVHQGDTSILSPLAFLAQALDLCGRSHTLHLTPIEAGNARAIETRKDNSIILANAAQRWFTELPIENEPQTSLTILIQAIHHTTLLKLFASYAFPALTDGSPVEPFTSTCLSSALAIVALSRTAKELNFARSSSPLFIFACWVAARNLFVHAFLTHQTRPDGHFDLLVEALRDQAVFWPVAKQYVKLLERAKQKWQQQATRRTDNLPDAVHSLLDLRRPVYTAIAGDTDPTPLVTPAEVDLSHLPAWAVQPLLGDLHSWFDFPAGFFEGEQNT